MPSFRRVATTPRYASPGLAAAPIGRAALQLVYNVARSTVIVNSPSLNSSPGLNRVTLLSTVSRPPKCGGDERTTSMKRHIWREATPRTIGSLGRRPKGNGGLAHVGGCYSNVRACHGLPSSSMLEVIDKGQCTPAHPVSLMFVHGGWHGAWCWDDHFWTSSPRTGFGPSPSAGVPRKKCHV